MFSLSGLSFSAFSLFFSGCFCLISIAGSVGGGSSTGNPSSAGDFDKPKLQIMIKGVNESQAIDVEALRAATQSIKVDVTSICRDEEEKTKSGRGRRRKKCERLGEKGQRAR